MVPVGDTGETHKTLQSDYPTPNICKDIRYSHTNKQLWVFPDKVISGTHEAKDVDVLLVQETGECMVQTITQRDLPETHAPTPVPQTPQLDGVNNAHK